jgi:hypothetical protein
MLKSYYRSSRTALVAGVAAFAVSVLLMRAFSLPGDLVFAPGLALQSLLNALGADLPRRLAVLTTLLAWCLVMDALFLLINRPWRLAQKSRHRS